MKKSDRKAGSYAGLLALAIMAVSLVFYIVFSTGADAFSASVAGCLLAAAVCEVISAVKPIGILPVVSCCFLCAGEVLFLRSILSSLVNYFTGVTMFGGTNEYGKIFAVAGLIVAALVVELISSFLPRTAKEA